MTGDTGDDRFDAPTTPIPRDRWGRPLVKPISGGKATAYTRCTTYVSCLEDTYNLGRWQQRMVALGLADRPDLLLSVAAHRDDKHHLNDITDKAREAARASAAATTGTALHSLTEQKDRGLTLGVVPDAYLADLTAYEQQIRNFEVLAIEQFRVHDDLLIGGTTDRVLGFEGNYYIGDVKTGSIEYSILKIAMQLAVYARSTPYNHITGTRTPDPFPINQDRGLVIHLPAGAGTCTLHWIDIQAGWEGVELATQVREWRARKDITSPFGSPPTLFDEIPGDDPVGEFLQLVFAAGSVQQLEQLYVDAIKTGVWCDQLLDACRTRKAELLASAA